MHTGMATFADDGDIPGGDSAEPSFRAESRIGVGMAGAADVMGVCSDGFAKIACGGVPRAGIAVASLGSGTNAAAVPCASVAHTGGVGSTAGSGGGLCSGGKHTPAAVPLVAILDGSSAGAEGS